MYISKELVCVHIYLVSTFLRNCKDFRGELLGAACTNKASGRAYIVYDAFGTESHTEV